VFRGRVIEIASEPEFTPKNVQSAEERVKLVVGVKIDLRGSGEKLKPGMPADAVIATPVR
jgi:HlyD family secretion protein